MHRQPQNKMPSRITASDGTHTIANIQSLSVTVHYTCSFTQLIMAHTPLVARVLFTLAVLVFRCLTDQAPSYLADDWQLVSDVRLRRLRLSDSVTCVVWCTRNTYGDRCFAAAGPRVWNSLPAELQQCDSLRQFKWRLKTYLFRIWDHGALWLLVRQCRIEIPLLTYLYDMTDAT